MRLVPLLVDIFWPWARFWSWVSKDQFLNVSVYWNNFQIINDIWTLELPLSATVFLNVLMNWSSNVAYALFNTNRHHLTDMLFNDIEYIFEFIILNLFLYIYVLTYLYLIYVIHFWLLFSSSLYLITYHLADTLVVKVERISFAYCLFFEIYTFFSWSWIDAEYAIWSFFIFHQNVMYQKDVNNLCC